MELAAEDEEEQEAANPFSCLSPDIYRVNYGTRARMGLSQVHRLVLNNAFNCRHLMNIFQQVAFFVWKIAKDEFGYRIYWITIVDAVFHSWNCFIQSKKLLYLFYCNGA